MSLGAVALKVSGGGGGANAIGREEVSMATLEAGTTQKRPLTGTVTLNKFRLNTYPREYLRNHRGGREERKRESTMIRKKAKIDPPRSASKATTQRNTSKRAHKEPCNSPRAAP